MKISFGPFEFDRETAELKKEGVFVRLAPQPSALLRLLLDAEGALVSRARIQQELWPDVHVDFEQSLHFCVRQLRRALDDTAGAPRFIETVPRRGYRFKAEITGVNLSLSTASPPEVAPSGARRVVRSRGPRSSIYVGLGLVALIAVVLGARSLNVVGRVGESSAPFRLAVVPFDDREGSDLLRIGEWVLAEVTNRLAERADVIGPRTVGPLLESGQSLGQLARTIDADYLLNVRRVDQNAVLFELIRTRDGRHIWVKYDAGREPWSHRAERIVRGVTERLSE